MYHGPVVPSAPPQFHNADEPPAYPASGFVSYADYPMGYGGDGGGGGFELQSIGSCGDNGSIGGGSCGSGGSGGS